jgi:hypothetical protein
MKRIGVFALALASAFLFSGTGSADPIGGTQYASGFLRPGEMDSYRIPLSSGELTVIEAVGDGDGDLDCRLFDDNGNLVASDTDSLDNCILRVAPKWTAIFKLVLVNSGHISENYVIKAF